MNNHENPTLGSRTVEESFELYFQEVLAEKTNIEESIRKLLVGLADEPYVKKNLLIQLLLSKINPQDTLDCIDNIRRITKALLLDLEATTRERNRYFPLS